MSEPKTCPFWAIAFWAAGESNYPDGYNCRKKACALWVRGEGPRGGGGRCGLAKP